MKPYQKRFIEEHKQLTERLSKLDAMLKKHAAGKLGFEPDCPIMLLQARKACDGRICGHLGSTRQV